MENPDRMVKSTCAKYHGKAVIKLLKKLNDNLPEDKLEQVKCVIPDRSYSTMYQAMLEDCRANGQFDWTTMGHTSNVGLMAQKAEE